MDYELKKNNFDLKQTFLCGQCFRWKENADGSFSGVAMGRRLTLSQRADAIVLHGANPADLPLWERYFDMDTDYGALIERFSADPILRRAAECSPGIRILRQEPFETLISFIISQNNNIPRISGIITRLCEAFGDPTVGGDPCDGCGPSVGGYPLDGGEYSFPSAQRLRGITPEDLAPLRAGFRARYICDAVEKVNSGAVDLEALCSLSTDEARAVLKTITGVGDKVADCVLLFAYHKLDAFPRDVWVKRIMSELYPNGLPECALGAQGVAQQYLFDYVRNNNGLVLETNA